MMIDLHNHILWGLDDGAADIEESLAIARQFVSEGVDIVAATPHYNPLRPNPDVARSIRDKVGELQEVLDTQGVPLRLLPGNELFLTPEAPRLLEEGTALTLGGSRAVLVEAPFDHQPAWLGDTLFQLQLEGFQPVLAHPERYSWVERDISWVEDLTSRGVVLQLTAPSLLGHYGKNVQRTSEMLLRRGLYAAAASDRHHPDQPRSLTDLHASIASLGDEPTADLLLADNPRALLNDLQVRQPGPSEEESLPLLERLFGGRFSRRSDDD